MSMAFPAKTTLLEH